MRNWGTVTSSPYLTVRLEETNVRTARAELAVQSNYDLWFAPQHLTATRSTLAGCRLMELQSFNDFDNYYGPTTSTDTLNPLATMVVQAGWH